MKFDTSKDVPFKKFKGMTWEEMFETEERRSFLNWLTRQEIKPSKWANYERSRNEYIRNRLKDFDQDNFIDEQPKKEKPQETTTELAVLYKKINEIDAKLDMILQLMPNKTAKDNTIERGAKEKISVEDLEWS